MRSMTLPIMLTLAAVCIAEPAAAQDARACVTEVQRLSEVFGITSSNAQPPRVSGQQPGDRINAGLGPEQDSEMRNLVQQARIAGERGDGVLCGEKLYQARTLLRQAGVGSVRPGAAGRIPPTPPFDRGENAVPRGTPRSTTPTAGEPTSPGTPDRATIPQGAEVPTTPPPR